MKPKAFCINCDKGLQKESSIRCKKCYLEHVTKNKKACKICKSPVSKEYVTYCRRCWIKLRRLNSSLNPAYNKNLTDEEREQRKEKRYSQSLTYKNLRQERYKKDNWTCVVCKFRTKTLVAHHINSYHWAKNQRMDINNLITLCSICHRRFHRQYGTKNNTRKQFNKFLKREQYINDNSILVSTSLQR